MALWMLRGGRAGERERRMLDGDVLVVGWQEMPDLSALPDREAIEAAYRRTYPDSRDSRIANHSAQLHEFVWTAQPGDLVVMPLSTQTAVAVAEITGDYVCRSDLGPGMNHTRPVRWMRKGIARELISSDLLSAFDGFATFALIPLDGAEESLRRLINDPTVADVAPPPPPSRALRPSRTPDIGRQSREQILEVIGKRFRGRELVRLSEAVLAAHGFETRRGQAGPGGSMSFLAAGGPLGLGPVRICVCLEPFGRPAGREALGSLRDSMDAVGAEQGLLIAWGGLESREIGEEESFFRIRVWDQERALENLLEVYERLPEELRMELSLKRIWVLAHRRPPS